MSRNTDKKKTKRSQNKANTTTLGEAIQKSWILQGVRKYISFSASYYWPSPSVWLGRLYPFSLQELMIRVS